MNLFLYITLLPLVLANKHTCPGGSYKCPDTATCCQLPDQSYGCCPMKNAVCCDDHIHCCPEGTVCETGMCVQRQYANATQQLKAIEKTPVEKTSEVCDKQQACPKDTTCCKNPSTGVFGCCPMENAVCCNDHQHCCPYGSTCNLKHKRCDGDGFSTQMYDSRKMLLKSNKPKKSLKSQFSDAKFLPLTAAKFNSTNTQCPDGSQCPGLQACCKRQSNEYGCCVFPNGNCCADGNHCCPQSMTCDPLSQYCIQGDTKIPSVSSVSVEVASQSNNVCPDMSVCEEYETCCQLGETRYGCCLYRDATCCSDFQHCCPQGNDCDVISKRCIPRVSVVMNV